MLGEDRALTVDEKSQALDGRVRARVATCQTADTPAGAGTGAETPAEHRSADRQVLESQSESQTGELQTKFGSCVMRASYLAQDDPTIFESVKSLSRRKSEPNETENQMLKGVGRHLRKYPMTASTFLVQSMFNMIRRYGPRTMRGDAAQR